MDKIKLVCFDVDGTLVEGNAWWILTKSLGCSVQDAIDTFEKAGRGEISFRTAERIFTKRYRESGNANELFIKNIFKNIHVKDEAKKIISYLREKNYKIYLISGAIDIYVGFVAKQLNVDGFYANSSLEFDEKGVLQKINYHENQGGLKIKQLRELTEKLGIGMDQVAFIGDSENDIEVFQATRHGIAVSSSVEELKKVAWKKVDSLIEIKNIL